MLIVGIESIDYKKKDGAQVCGVKYYYTEVDKNNKKLDGERCDSLYIPQTRYTDLADVLENVGVGSEIDVLYNRFGGVKDIRILDK